MTLPASTFSKLRHDALATMHFSILTFAALLATATATVLPRADCAPATYRCDSSFTAIEACGISGWFLQAPCNGATCKIDQADGLPHCY
jgi:hypothetical protein